MVQSTNSPSNFVVTQSPPPGAVTNDETEIPKVFSKLKIKGVEFNNRFVVSPMCTYSSLDGFPTDWHLIHYGQFALHGVGLTIVEATSVTFNGRITPSCTGIWKDEHIDHYKRITEFIHTQGNKVGIQLAHAGRKASTFSPFHANSRGIAKPEDGGWVDIHAPSAEAWSESFLTPNEMSLDQINDTIQAFKNGALRAHKAGFDVIEIHGAHGYLIHEFLSPISNKRTDNYGGSFNNRIRFLLEIVEAVRSVWPEDKPLFTRLSCTDWVTDEANWDLLQTIELSHKLNQLGVDLIDCSSSGNSPKQQIPAAPLFQVPFAAEIRAQVPGLLTGAVGLITTPQQANSIIEEDKADLVFMAREFLRNPSFVKDAAHELGVHIKWSNQYERGRPRPKVEAF